MYQSKYMLNGKTMIILLTVGLIKKHISLYKMSYFPETYTHSKIKIKVELDLSNYETLKSAAGIDTSNFAKKDDLSSLKSDFD